MKLAEWLKLNRVSARDLAARADTTEATISRLRNARAQPSMELAQRIADATGGAVTPNDFLDAGPGANPDGGASLSGKQVLLVIAGGIAAYKSLDLIRRLRERGAGVRVVLTRAGAQFVTPLSVGALAGQAPYTDLFDPRSEFDVGHIRLARECDLVIVAPATADIMAKTAHGQADDLATAILLATGAPVLLAPAMNPHMWANGATQRNIARLVKDGVTLIGPNAGEMAEAGEAGLGRMAEVAEIVAGAQGMLGGNGQPLSGKTAVVTSGPTHEPIDPVRYIANRSSGKQGHAIAAALARAGASVTLVAGPVQVPDPAGVTTVHVESARQMLKAVENALPCDIGVFAAAVADWRSAQLAEEKMKKEKGVEAMALDLVQNPDILKLVSRGHKRPALVIGFAAETQDVIANARAKRKAKGCDWIVANDVSHETGIMGGDSNAVHLVTAEGEEDWPQMSKDQVAARLVAKIAEQFSHAKESR